jgi:hypothetical protein
VEKSGVQIPRRAQGRREILFYLRQKDGSKKMQETSIPNVRLITIANLLEDYANSSGEGLLPSYKREAWNIAQDLRKKVSSNN